MKPSPPLHRAVGLAPVCGFGPESRICGAIAEVHMCWSAEMENSFACSRHAEVARECWSVHDEHPVVPDCSHRTRLWRWSWVTSPGFCFDPDETSALLAEAAQPLELAHKPSGRKVT